MVRLLIDYGADLEAINDVGERAEEMMHANQENREIIRQARAIKEKALIAEEVNWILPLSHGKIRL